MKIRVLAAGGVLAAAIIAITTVGATQALAEDGVIHTQVTTGGAVQPADDGVIHVQ